MYPVIQEIHHPGGDVSDAEEEEEVEEGAIPSENMGLIASLLSDHALDFPR